VREVREVRAEDTRDRIIVMYKDEIKSQSARDRDFLHLKDQIADLERKTRLLQVNIADSEKDHEDRLLGQDKAMNHHGGDIDSLKKNVQEKQSEGVKLYEDIQDVKT
jgi:hypothetical protein